MTSDVFAKGECLCGSVQYVLRSPPLRAAQCHCKQCQRASGTGHMSLAFFNEADVEVRGETTDYTSKTDLGNQNTRKFCPKCGSRLFSNNSARPGVMGVAVGCVNDNSWFEPAAVVYCSLREDWDITSTNIPNFDKMPPPPPAD